MSKHRIEAGILLYFLVTAVFVSFAPGSWGEERIFYAMAAAAAVIGLGYGLFRLITWWVRKMNTSFRELRRYLMMGPYIPEEVEGSVIASGESYGAMEPLHPDKMTRRLDPEPSTALVHYEPDADVRDGMYLGMLSQTETYVLPSIKFLLGNNAVIIGLRGAGKSNTMAVLAEEVGMQQVPLLLLDTVGEYEMLCHPDYLPRAATVGSLSHCKRRKQDGHDASLLVALDERGAYEFGKYLMEHHLQAVLHLPSWSDEEAGKIMCEAVTGIRDWERNRHQTLRIPCVILMDEASKWLPQNPKESTLSDETRALLNATFFGPVVDQGRKDGLSLILSTQRYARLNKNAMQCDWRFLHRQMEKADLDGYKLYGIDPTAAMSLQTGACFLFSPIHSGDYVQMRERTSPHGGHTPGLAALQKHYVAPVEYLPHQQFYHLPEQVATYQAMPPREETEPLAPAQPRLTQAEQLALQAWEEGHQTLRKAHAWIDAKHPGKYSQDVIYRALSRLSTRGMIQFGKVPVEQ